MAEHNELGAKGEEMAVAHLRKNGYDILACNWRYRSAEVDIIAKKDDTLAVVEVKTRRSNYFGEPEEFVSRKQQQNLVMAANEYVLRNDLDVDVRFDIVSIIFNEKQQKLYHIEGAFYPRL